jgi:hypothetical protein
MRIAATHAMRLAIDVVDAVYNAAGATSVYDGQLIQRGFPDIHLISQHIEAHRAHYELLVGTGWDYPSRMEDFR